MTEPRQMRAGTSDGSDHSKTPHRESFWCGLEPKCPPMDEEPESPRASLLDEAKALITGDRNNQYGPPTQDFQRTAALMNALGYRRVDAEDIVHEIVPSDVGLIVMQVKLSRAMHSRQKRDHYADMAGYAACSYECAIEEEKSDG